MFCYKCIGKEGQTENKQKNKMKRIKWSCLKKSVLGNTDPDYYLLDRTRKYLQESAYYKTSPKERWKEPQAVEDEESRSRRMYWTLKDGE